MVKQALGGVALSVRVLRLAGIPIGGDAYDWIAAGGGAADLAAAAEHADKESEPEPEPSGGEKPWPVLDAAAYYGLAGDITETISPHSEADEVGLLVQTLVAAGNMIGRRAYYMVESDRHYPTIFAIPVGQSSKARKGTSWGRVCAVARHADQQWVEGRTRGGLSSGEGLINVS
jgi:hypothetical protein